MGDEISPLPPKVVVSKQGHVRVRQARRVSWRCEWCSQEHEEWRYPGPLPRYCEVCRREAQNAMAAAAMARKRQAEREKRPWVRRLVGRPRKV